MARVDHKERGSTQRLAQIVGLAALGLALALPGAALADLGPPSTAPAIAKRKCARYLVVKGPAGPAASCTGYQTERLRAATSRSGSKPAVGGYLPTLPGRGAPRPQTVAPNRSRARSRSPGAARASLLARRPSQDRAAWRRSSTGMSLGVVLGIMAASALTGIALVALMRKPLVRWRDDHARGTAS
jgi:hypothetical protein